jgi:hypothetical protein
MIKQMYAQAGKSGISRGRFALQWREHGGHAMMCTDYFDHVDRYVQADVLAVPTTQAGGDASYFGVGELCFADRAAREANLRAPSRAEQIVPHGQSIFGHAQPIALACEEHELLRRRQGMVKVYAFLRRDSALSREAFQRRWTEMGQALCATLSAEPGACACVQGHPVEDAAAFDGVDELSFDDAAAATRFVNTAYRNAIAPLAQASLLVTEQVVMYKRANYA